MNNIISLNTIPSLAENTFGPITERINFDVEFEPTKAPHKKYVINNNTGQYLDTVGDTFTCVSHPEFFSRVQETMIEELAQPDLINATCDFRVARNNAWALMDIKLPEVKVSISTNKGFQTEVSWRAIALHGIDGSCSNQVFFGGIEAFCTNGQISGEWAKVRRKNTSGFVLSYFINELRVAKVAFFEHGKKIQKWADTRVYMWDVENAISAIIPSERKAEKMLELYAQEADVRGHNVYALYSAMTNYSTYADDRNGFSLRNTRNDTQAISMWKREHEVSKWISTPQFQQLAA